MCCVLQRKWPSRTFALIKQEGLAVASIARDVVVEMTPPCQWSHACRKSSVMSLR